MTRTSQIATVLLTVLVAFAASGCGAGDAPHVIDETRTLDRPRADQAMPLDTKSRMGLADGMGGTSGFRHPPMGGAEAPAAATPFAWDLPKGWIEVAPTQMRVANFKMDGRDRLECYVTVLAGGAGGLAANLNRWRTQMGLIELSEADIAALPRWKVLGADAPFLVAEGARNDDGNGSATAGVVVERAGSAIFVKMVGPAADVAAETESFRALCASLRDAAPAAPAAPTAAAGHDAGGLSWTAPQGWTQGPAKQMRLVTFVPDGAAGVECFVTVLSGKAGGVEANVNRWRGQFSLAPLSADALAKLPTVQVLGRAAPWVEIDGGKVGMYGLVCELGTQTVFVKMTGPMELLRAERERFLAFCMSLS